MFSRKLRYPLILSSLALVLLPAGAAQASVAGAHSLQIPPGARANGLGETGVAIAADATASWWNPAGLGFMQGRTLGFMHTQLVPDLANDIYYEYGAWVHQIEGLGTYSISLIYLSYGESIQTIDSPEEVGRFNSFEFAPAIAYGVRLDNNTAIGIGLKYVRVDLAPVEAVPDFNRDGAGSSVAVDFGFLRRFGSRLNLGFALTNFGPNISFINEEQSDPMPRHVKFGFAFIPVVGQYGHILLCGDFNKMIVTGGPTILNGGVEVQYQNIMALRMGYVHDPDGDITDLTFGGGFHVPLAGRDFFLDYASIPQASDLDRVHRFSFEILF